MDYGHTIDDWAEESEEDYCNSCEDWTDDDGHGNCKACGISFNTVDPFVTPQVAKVYSSPAPTVSAQGDLYGRSAGYTWGRGGSWWSSGVGAMTSMWGSNSADSDRKTRMLKHKRHLDSLCKVVDPTVKHRLDFATEKSYSNLANGSIFVDGSLLNRDDTKLDVVAGLAIHEKLHLVHTKPLLAWERSYSHQNMLTPTQERLLHSIGNIIEDEYIESQLAKTHAGFTSYIEKVKEHYFAKHGEKIQTDDSFGDILNTLLAFIRYPSALSEDRKKKHAKHLQFFARALAPAYTNRESSLEAIEAVYEYMFQIAKEIADKKAEEGASEEEIEKRTTERMDDIMSRWDDEALEPVLGKEDLEKIRTRIKEDVTDDLDMESKHMLTNTLDKGISSSAEELSDYMKGIEHISESLRRDISDLEDTEYTEEKWDMSKALGLRQGSKVTWRNQRSNEDAMFNYKRDCAEMKSAIGQLKRRIQLFGNINHYTLRNQRKGKLDKRMLHKIPLGRQDLFKNVIVDQDKPLDVCLLVDESGSMGSYKMTRARQAAIALREALKDNDALNLWVFGHTADGYDWDGTGETNMSCYWSPTYQHDLQAMGAMRARSENRDGMAILASAERVKSESPSMGNNKLMIVISDGEPSAKNYRYSIGVPHTKKAVSHLEGQGWNIIELGISGARESSMAEMFRNYVVVQDMSLLSNTISKIIRKVIKV